MIPTSRLVVLLLALSPLALAPMFAVASWPAIVAAWTAVAVAVGVELAILGSARLAISMTAPSSWGVGADIPASATLDLASPTTLHATLRAIASAPVVAGADTRMRLASGRSEVRLPLRADRRGKGALDEVWLRLVGPMGLLARIERADAGAHPILIVPDVQRVDRTTMEVLGSQPLLGGLKREKWTGEGGEFESLQQYTLGMDLGAVDWKASARHQSLRVRRFHVERRQRVVLCLDVGRAMRDPIAFPDTTRPTSDEPDRAESAPTTVPATERLDVAIHTALVLAKAALRAGDLVGMHAYGGEPRAWVPARGGPGQFGRLRAGAAALRTETEETNHVLGLHDLLRRLDRRSMIVVLTEFSDATTAELMVEALGQLARRHVIVFVALDDPMLEQPLDDIPDDPTDLAAALVASSLAQRRHLVLARLARAGAHVVHSRPGGVAAELVERYVKIKSRGLIG